VKPGEVFRACIVQIDPSQDTVYGGSFLLVTDFDHLTVTGYVLIPRGEDLDPGYTFLQRDMDMVAMAGRATWLNGTFLVQCLKCGNVIQPTDTNLCGLCDK